MSILPGRDWWTGLPPAAGAAVMATGIISVGLYLTGYGAVSLVALVVAGVLWLVLAADFTSRLLGDRGRFRAEADTPGALTAVAATTIIGTRLAQQGWRTAAAVLLAVAALLWPGLLLNVVRHWRRRMPGAAFLGCVATQGLSVLAASLADAGHQDWLARAALVTFCLGLLCYVAALFRFDLREVVGGAGDHWVAGGALSISALAGSKLTASPVWTGSAHTALRTVTLALLAVSLVWYVVLLAAELRHPRPRYDIRRWATVFPLGMTATACLSVADPAGIAWLRPLGEVLLWIAVGAWLLTFAALVVSHLTAGRAAPGR
ncbi:tellurite resistance/C4-dicarboxylate transporter family protein [Streptomyces avidinii]|uniref:Tellurite resistance protein TehA-like permease n=1 Tax=Streptomyces avidinii TaxID=1895 RepID=A0ABS4KYJ7_STRAV|nr:tellurite resistance/C4-dicarboxylate transporter family protein [Streptomyces avidinii]MBP2035116.1 tellurite resistance protein TehA-like permease [Streptomyces avidinii]GGY91315.1 membrane protein [Streptomyces avidinii]